MKLINNSKNTVRLINSSKNKLNSKINWLYNLFPNATLERERERERERVGMRRCNPIKGKEC